MKSIKKHCKNNDDDITVVDSLCGEDVASSGQFPLTRHILTNAKQATIKTDLLAIKLPMIFRCILISVSS